MMISLLGRLIPFRRTGTALRKGGYTLASQAAKMHHEQTKRNWTMVRVTGFGRAVRMALDEVFDRIEVAYQKPQSDFLTAH